MGDREPAAFLASGSGFTLGRQVQRTKLRTPPAEQSGFRNGDLGQGVFARQQPNPARNGAGDSCYSGDKVERGMR